MHLKSTYQKDKYLTVICEDFDSTDVICQNLQKMLESKKFVLFSGEFTWQWQRQEFNEIPQESFEFWLSQVTKLCNKYGNEPIEVIQETKGSECLIAVSTNDNYQVSGVQGASDSILAQLAQLKEEIATLKKFDCDAMKKLQHLNELLVRQAVRIRL
ncbi:hypothetical protein LC605_20750 [Nostoc sp. CHAB 5836]|uniref:hypothetical protein n=1 Tax=Nostoc sp. CHAB 5836 TaxID=2780404 RepID=UPI001E36E302|nr:hypothetical protein [Nostoc sp. CHAB 5836]MCC5617471.1 hypothetical protein [Nostoc sp. CHAB 5836]